MNPQEEVSKIMGSKEPKKPLLNQQLEQLGSITNSPSVKLLSSLISVFYSYNIYVDSIYPQRLIKSFFFPILNFFFGGGGVGVRVRVGELLKEETFESSFDWNN